MDLPSIMVVLAINRNTIKLRDLLNKERKKRKNEQTEREIKAASEIFDNSKLMTFNT